MKRLTVVILLLAAILSACAPKQENTSDPTSAGSDDKYRKHQELTALDVSFNADEMMRISIPEAGLENVFIREASAVEQLYENTYGQVYLLGDDRYGGGRGEADHYLAVVTYEKIFVEDVSNEEGRSGYSGDIGLCDLDGDGDSEILLQETVGMTGGAGSYLSRVFDFSGGRLTEIFSSENDAKQDHDTGFSITILENNTFSIKNAFTGYEEEFNLKDRPRDYYEEYWYDENGDPQQLEIMVDSFYEFLPVDTDGDGVYEIECRQYVSLTNHADWIGNAKTVLKYNKDASAFEVISAEFEVDEE